MENNNLLYRIHEKLRIFFRPFYDNGSCLTAEEGYRQKIYEPIYSKSKNCKNDDSTSASKTALL